MELIYEKYFQIEAIHADCFGRARPGALLYFVQEAAGEHCRLLGVDNAFLEDKNLFWAVSRSRLQIDRLPRMGERIRVQTWPMPTSRVAYPRAVAAYDAEGKLLFRCVSLWVLMDRTCRNLILPGKSGVPVAGSLTGRELELPHAIGTTPPDRTAAFRVGFSLLDENGHMNNTRYCDWLIDLLPSTFHREHPLRECVICYLSEAREGDEISLGYTLSEEGALTVDARRNSGQQDTRIFSAQLLF